MFVPWLALPADCVVDRRRRGRPEASTLPPSCQGAAQAGYIATTRERLKNCIDTEHRTRDKLDKDWASFPVADRRSVRLVNRGLRADLQRARDLP